MADLPTDQPTDQPIETSPRSYAPDSGSLGEDARWSSLWAAMREQPAHRFTFAQFMEWALYHPQFGYYGSGRVQIHRGGDFLTSPEISPVFGQLLAVQVGRFWRQMGRPGHWTVVEGGAGSGSLAVALLNALRQEDPQCYDHLTYALVERSPTARRIQQQRLTEHPVVHWADWTEGHGLVGCVLSNELLDALPVHRIRWHHGDWQEIYVQPGDPLIETVDALSTPRIREYLALSGLTDPPMAPWTEGYTTEIHLAVLDWLSQVDRLLDQGYVLTIDYGHPAHRYYQARRTQGSLLCYHQHRTSGDPYQRVGEQDITAHVNWTAVEAWGSRLGWQRVTSVSQSEFLAELGLLDRLAALSQATDLAVALDQRQRYQALLDPAGLGGLTVLIQAKGLPSGHL
ncbi:MAG: SAM-dependent methyltransferase [Synechococcales cyanobacterium]